MAIWDFMFLFVMMLAVDVVFHLFEGDAVFSGDVGGVADALRRRDTDLEAPRAAVDAGDQAFGAAVAFCCVVQLVD